MTKVTRNTETYKLARLVPPSWARSSRPIPVRIPNGIAPNQTYKVLREMYYYACIKRLFVNGKIHNCTAQRLSVLLCLPRSTAALYKRKMIDAGLARMEGRTLICLSWSSWAEHWLATDKAGYTTIYVERPENDGCRKFIEYMRLNLLRRAGRQQTFRTKEKRAAKGLTYTAGGRGLGRTLDLSARQSWRVVHRMRAQGKLRWFRPKPEYLMHCGSHEYDVDEYDLPGIYMNRAGYIWKYSATTFYL